MGVACNIIKNTEGNIEYVQSPYNGERSQLYQNALNYTTDENQALDIWLTSNTPSFKNIVYNPEVAKYRKNVFSVLNEIVPSYESIELLHRGKQHTIYPDSLSYETVDSGNTKSLVASVNIGNEKLQIGRIRYTDDGYSVTINSSLLNKRNVYVDGAIEDISGKGVGTEMYKELITQSILEGKDVYSDTETTLPASNIWRKLSSLTIREDGRYSILAYPADFVNREPSLGRVIDFISASNSQEELNAEDISKLQVAMAATEVVDSNDLQDRLETGFYPDGYFNPTQESLESSELYTSPEISRILSDFEIQETIKKTIEKLKNTDVNIPNSILLEPDFISVSNYSVDEIGKNTIDNPYINQQEALQLLGGIKSQDDFETELEDSSLEYLKEAYRQNPDEIFSMFSENYNRVPRIRITENGIENYTTNTQELFEETLRIPTSNRIQENIAFLGTLRQEVYETSQQDVKEILVDIRESAAREMALNLPSLEDMYGAVPHAEIMGFLRNLNTFIQEGNIETFSVQYDEFFSIDNSPKNRVVKVQQQSQDKSLVYLETRENTYNLFRNFGLLHLGDGVHQRVNLNTPVDTLYENLYANIIINQNILPEAAYYPTGFDKDGGLNVGKVKSPQNKEKIIYDIRNFVQREIGKIDTYDAEVNTDVLQQMYIYSSFFNTKLDNREEAPGLSESKTRFEQSSNIEYLSTDFISDFRAAQIVEMQKDSEIYQQYYSRFYIDAEGIQLISNDPISLTQIRPYIDENMSEYMRISKNFENEQQYSYDVDTGDINYLRDYYTSFPQTLPKFTGNYNLVGDQNVITTEGINDPFIKVNGVVYENINNIGNRTFYGQLPIINSPYLTTGVIKPDIEINMEIYQGDNNAAEPTISTRNIYNNRQDELITQELEC